MVASDVGLVFTSTTGLELAVRGQAGDRGRSDPLPGQGLHRRRVHARGVRRRPRQGPRRPRVARRPTSKRPGATPTCSSSGRRSTLPGSRSTCSGWPGSPCGTWPSSSPGRNPSVDRICDGILNGATSCPAHDARRRWSCGPTGGRASGSATWPGASPSPRRGSTGAGRRRWSRRRLLRRGPTGTAARASRSASPASRWRRAPTGPCSTATGSARDDEELVAKAARRVLVIDDHGTGGDRGADLVVDQNLGATAAPYEADDPARPSLRPVAPGVPVVARAGRAVPGQARRLLVALGGAPSDEVSSLVSEALAHPSLADLDVTFLDGRRRRRHRHGRRRPRPQRVGHHVLGAVLHGTPAVLLPVAANQEPLAPAMHRSCIAHNAGPLASVTPAGLAATVADLAGDRDRRVEMARRGPQLVDGRGARRVVTRMRSHLLELRAGPRGRRPPALGMGERPRRAGVRLRQRADRLGDPRRLAGGAPGRPLRPPLPGDRRRRHAPRPGPVRGRCATDVELSVSVAPAFRGAGWGPALIDAAVRRLFEETSVQGVLARVKPENARVPVGVRGRRLRPRPRPARRVRPVRPPSERRQGGEIGPWPRSRSATGWSEPVTPPTSSPSCRPTTAAAWSGPSSWCGGPPRPAPTRSRSRPTGPRR